MLKSVSKAHTKLLRGLPPGKADVLPSQGDLKSVKNSYSANLFARFLSDTSARNYQFRVAKTKVQQDWVAFM